jgi:hypothetical protein
MSAAAAACEMTITSDLTRGRTLEVVTGIDKLCDHVWRSSRELAHACGCNRVVITYHGSDAAEPIRLQWELQDADASSVRVR